MKKHQTIKALLMTSARAEADMLISMYDHQHYKVTNATLPKLKLLYLIKELTKGELYELIRAYEHMLQDKLSRYTYNVQPTITPSTTQNNNE